MREMISVICVNDGISVIVATPDHARAQGWAVYTNPSPEQIEQGIGRGLCPDCSEDAFASGAYL